MATAIFDGTGADPSDWSAADNWTGGSGVGGVPDTGDSVVVRSIPKPIASNTTAFVAIAIALFQATGACAQSVTATSPIQFAAITALEYGGSADVFKVSSTACTLATIQPQRGTFVCAGTGAGAWTEINAGGAGKLVIDSTAVPVTVRTSIETEDASNATGYTLFEVSKGANARIWRPCATYKIDGTVITNGTATITTTAEISAGGKLIHQSSGTITHYAVRGGGTFSITGNLNSTFTITNHRIWQGAIVIDLAPGCTPVKTNPAKYVGSWGTPSVAA